MENHKHGKRDFLVAVYGDDEVLLHAVDKIRARGLKIADVFTPFPVHHLDDKMGLRPSRIPDAGFVFGAIGTTTAVSMMTYIYTIDWQINIGGKSTWPLPSFIPITFELTVLFCALGMVAVYFFVNRMMPGLKSEIVDPRQTDNKFIVIIEAGDEAHNDKVRKTYQESGAEEVRVQQLEAKWYNLPDPSQ